MIKILTVLFSFLFSLIFQQNILPQTNNDSDSKSKSNLSQYYSGKFGFYNPGNGLNNGLLFGIDGITEFNNYDFFLSGAIDLYQKKTIDIFEHPKPQIVDQHIILIPLYLNAAYKIFSVKDADTKFYTGIGGGYNLYFYSIDYRTQTGGLLGGLTSKSETFNGGNVFFSIFARILIGKIFIEPRYYFASEKEGTAGTHKFIINPSGFAITLGFQY